MNRRMLALPVAAALLIAGCLVPEQFKASVTVKETGAYIFKYTGTALHAMAAAQQKQAGPLSAADEKELQQEADKLAKEPEIKKVVYKGQGRYELNIESAKKAGEPLKMLDVFVVNTDKSGVMTITTVDLKPQDKEQLKSIGIKIDGTFEVSLPSNAEVLSHNATSTPTLGGLLGSTYGWKIGSVDERPVMKIRLKR